MTSSQSAFFCHLLLKRTARYGFDGALEMKNKKNYAFIELAILALSLSGCRFGNFTEPPKQSSMKIWELGLEAKSFETIVITTDLDANGNNVMIRNPNTPMVGIPSSVDASFPNPVALVFPGDSSSPFFYNFSNQYALATTVSAQNGFRPVFPS